MLHSTPAQHLRAAQFSVLASCLAQSLFFQELGGFLSVHVAEHPTGGDVGATSICFTNCRKQSVGVHAVGMQAETTQAVAMQAEVIGMLTGGHRKGIALCSTRTGAALFSTTVTYSRWSGLAKVSRIQNRSAALLESFNGDHAEVEKPHAGVLSGSPVAPAAGYHSAWSSSPSLRAPEAVAAVAY